ncbi:MAG TPA: hypothetical protein EYM79_11230 [Planctomycetes bacterium]|nr:hypothetical protein [Planctomycetota bacterium]
MSRIIAILIANFFVVDYGVLPDGKDNSVYIIQIEPEVASQLVAGYVIESVIPPELRGIRKFRIQIGDDKLIKPTPLLIVREEQEGVPVANPGPTTADADGKPNEVPEGEATGVDIDAFPLPAEPGKSPPAENPRLIPEQVDTAELPGNPVGLAEVDKNVREVLEPDATTLPQLAATPTAADVPAAVITATEIVKQSDAEAVVVPMFDKPDSEVIVELSADDQETAVPLEDLLGNADADDRIVLVPLPELAVASDENTNPMRIADHEPELLEDDASNFVRLATTTSKGEDATSRNSSVKATKTLAPEHRSWPLFSITLLGLLVSVGGNVYLGMTVFDFYRQRHGTSSDLAKPSDTVSE